jgi:3-oxoacyl-[acyl-carrier protein] reductase
MGSAPSKSCGMPGCALSTDELRGRVALVTGGSGGIGAAICRELAARGVSVAVGYGRSAKAAEALVTELSAGGVPARAFGADMEDPDAPAGLVDEVEQTLGPADILVANHGNARPAGYEELNVAAFDRTLAINLRAPFLLAQAVLPGMRERGFGRILFISSVAAFRGGIIGADYAASKAGLHGLTHFLASRAAADGVSVNALAPGLIETSMLPGDPEQLAGTVPVGRLGRPEEVADLAAAILANGYLTNQVLSLDGGSHPR